MRKILLLLLTPLLLFSLVNPYQSLSIDEKLQILINHFLNEELVKKLPLKPIKGELEDSSEIVPFKHELYFNYIQRLKAIKESREAEQKQIEEKYDGEVQYYNGEIKNLQKYYSKKENIHQIVQNSINKAFKIIYGKPMITKLNYSEDKQTIYGLFYVEDIYGFHNFEDIKIKFVLPDDIKEQFYYEYRTSKVFVNFNYENDKLSLKDLTIIYKTKPYKALFQEFKKEYNIKLFINQTLFNTIKK